MNLKKYELSKEDVKYSQALIATYETIFKELDAYEKEKAKAADKMEQLKTQLFRLTDQMVTNTFAEKESLETLKKQRRDIQYEIEDLKLICEVNAEALIKEKFRETVENLEHVSARRECEKYRAMIDDDIERLKKESEEKIKELAKIQNSHPFITAEEMYKRFVYLNKK